MSAVSAVWVVHDTWTDATEPPWIQVRLVRPDRPRPRRWRALLRARGYSSAAIRRIARDARWDMISDGKRFRVLDHFFPAESA